MIQELMHSVSCASGLRDRRLVLDNQTKVCKLQLFSVCICRLSVGLRSPITKKERNKVKVETGGWDCSIGLLEYVFVPLLRYPIELCF